MVLAQAPVGVSPFFCEGGRLGAAGPSAGWLKKTETSMTSAIWSKREAVTLSMAASKRRGVASSSAKNKRYKEGKQEEDEDDETSEEDALEALFTQLEKDLEAARSGKKPGVEINEEEIAAFEHELGATFSNDNRKKKGQAKSPKKEENAPENVSDPGDITPQGQEDTRSGLSKFIEEAQRIESERVTKRIVRLEKWQLRKLKAALDLGKHQLHVKALAGETGLDRSDVLTFLRNPPPQLLELVDSLSDTDDEGTEVAAQKDERHQQKKNEAAQKTEVVNDRIALASERIEDGPRSWYGKKRIRKEHLETFEKVYQRSKRPTGALIQNMVELTHVPRKRILDWFENRRREHASRKENKALLRAQDNMVIKRNLDNHDKLFDTSIEQR